MLSFKTTAVCLLLAVTSIMTRSAVVPSTPTTAPPDRLARYESNGKACTCHDDCTCSIGLGVCFNGYCCCVWAFGNPGSLSEAEILAIMSRHSSPTSGSTHAADDK